MNRFPSYRRAALAAALTALACPAIASASSPVANLTDATTGMKVPER